MIRIVLTVAALAACAHAQVLRIPVTLEGATPVQAVFSYDAPDASACSVKVVEAGQPDVLVHDVDGALFDGAGQDLSRSTTLVRGTRRTITIGLRTSDLGKDGRLYSRALQAATRHTLSVNCTRSIGDVAFDTQNPPLGNTYPETPPFNAAGFGNYAWPTVDWSDASKTYIDPMTGLLLKPAHAIHPKGELSEWGDAVETHFSDVFDVKQTWQNAASLAAGSVSGPFAAYSGASSDPVFLPFPKYSTVDWVTIGGWDPTGKIWDDVRITLYGYGSDANADNRTVLVCLSAFYTSGTNACSTKEIELTLPVGSAGAIATPDFPKASFAAWKAGRFFTRDEASTPAGIVKVANSVVSWSSGYYFPLTMPAGVRIKLGASWYTVASVDSATQLTLTEPAVTVKDPVAYQLGGFGVCIRKKTALGTVNLNASWLPAWTRAPDMPITGAAEICSRLAFDVDYQADGVTRMNPPRQGRLCFMGAQAPLLFLLIPETGETRVISALQHRDAPSEFPATVPFGAFSTDDPLSLYGYHGDDVDATPGATALYRITYDPGLCHFRAWPGNNYRLPGPDVPTDCVSWTNLTPNTEGRGVVTQFRAAVSQNPFWNPAVMSKGHVGFGAIAGNSAFFYQYFGGAQDTPCFMATFDLTTGNLTQVVDSLGGSSPGLRWAGCHTTPSISADKWFAVGLGLLVARNDPGYLGGPFQIRSVDALSKDSGATWSNDTSLTSLDAGVCTTTDPAMIAKGAFGERCLKIRISSDYPCNILPANGDAARYPCPWNKNLASPMTLQPGDFLSDMRPPSPGGSGVDGKAEKMLILSKTDAGGGNWELELMRWATCDDAEYYSHITAPYGSAHANGWQAYMAGTNMCSGVYAWLDGTDASHTFYTDSSAAMQGHAAVGPAPDGMFATVVDGAVSRVGPIPGQFNAPANFVQNLYTSTFAGISRISGEAVESYPTLGLWSASDAEKNFAFDLRHLNPSFSYGPEAPSAIWPQSYALVPGLRQVYKIDNYGNVYGKVLPYLAFAGRYLLKDISGPASAIGDADEWRFCVAYRAGECRADSGTYDVYVNVPRASMKAACLVNTYALNYPCFTTPFGFGAWAIQYRFTLDDPGGTHYRRLTMGFTGPGRQYQFSSIHASPEGRWAFLNSGWVDGVRPEAMMVKLPPPPVDDGVDRSSYLPVRVNIAPDASATRARVRFGYAENGPVSAFFCTSRQEACVTDDQVAPFAYEKVDALTPAACSAGCTLQIPALPGRVVYYRVERLDDDGNVLSTDGTQAAVAP